MRTYDEGAILTRLSSLNRRQRTAFATACAERLAPLFIRYAEMGSVNSNALRGVIDDIWRALSGATSDLAGGQEVAENLVPDEDDEWSADAGYAQSAAACVAYAVRSWRTDDPQEALWAVRQFYEAADLAAQQPIDLQSGATVGSDELGVDSELVQPVLKAIESDLTFVEQSDDFGALAQRAAQEGARWAGRVP